MTKNTKWQIVTFTRPIENANGFRVISFIVRLHTNQVRVGLSAERPTQGQDMVIGIVEHTHHLSTTYNILKKKKKYLYSW